VSVGTTSFYIKRNNTEQGTVVFKNTSSYSDLSLVSQSIFPSYGSNIYYIPLPEPQLCFKMDTKIRIYDIKEGKEKDEKNRILSEITIEEVKNRILSEIPVS
jgi:hypothetical protein